MGLGSPPRSSTSDPRQQGRTTWSSSMQVARLPPGPFHWSSMPIGPRRTWWSSLLPVGRRRPRFGHRRRVLQRRRVPSLRGRRYIPTGGRPGDGSAKTSRWRRGSRDMASVRARRRVNESISSDVRATRTSGGRRRRWSMARLVTTRKTQPSACSERLSRGQWAYARARASAARSSAIAGSPTIRRATAMARANVRRNITSNSRSPLAPAPIVTITTSAAAERLTSPEPSAPHSSTPPDASVSGPNSPPRPVTTPGETIPVAQVVMKSQMMAAIRAGSVL